MAISARTIERPSGNTNRRPMAVIAVHRPSFAGSCPRIRRFRDSPVHLVTIPFSDSYRNVSENQFQPQVLKEPLVRAAVNTCVGSRASVQTIPPGRQGPRTGRLAGSRPSHLAHQVRQTEIDRVCNLTQPKGSPLRLRRT